MTDLRPYQREAIDAVFAYWSKEGGSPLLDLATGTGKSVVIATLLRELLEEYPLMRVLCLVHVRELVRQNFEQLMRAWPGAPAGINSAGLGRRDWRHPILFASVQSVFRNPHLLGRRDLVLIDEAHLVPKSAGGMYAKLLDGLRVASPDLRLFGCTATPFRLDSGRLDRGDDRLFDRVVYSYGIREGVNDKWLTPLISKGMATQIDVAGVARRGGEFIPGALEAAADRDDVTKAAVTEIVTYGAGRRSWLVFCVGIEHATHARNEIESRGISVALVTGKTPREERDATLAAFKAGRLRCVVNVSVLTTGFDAPGVDLIAMLRPTLSTGLYVQMLGRGTRLAKGKETCLVLDFSGNVRRHGPVDRLAINSQRGAGGGQREQVSVKPDDVRARECLHCMCLSPLDAKECAHCGQPFTLEAPHAPIADTAPIMPGPDDGWEDVTDFRCYRHVKRSGEGRPTVRVVYGCGLGTHTEWVCPEHDGMPRRKFEKWWRDRGGAAPYPKTVDETLDRITAGDIETVTAIRTAPDGDFLRVIAVRTSPQPRDLFEEVT